MLTVSREQAILLGVTPPPQGEVPLSPQTTVKKLKKSAHFYRRQEPLTVEQKDKLREVLSNIYREWQANTSLLRNKLRKANDLMEGIKDAKDFPWEGCSNLHVPIIEIHITILHSVVSSTMLDNDPIWYVRIKRDDVPEGLDSEIESFLNSVSKLELKIDSTLSDIYWNAYRDGTAFGDLDWVEEYSTQYDILRFMTPESFIEAFPTPESAGISFEKYNGIIEEIVMTGEVQLKVEEYIAIYRGPKLRQVELKNLVIVPTTSPTLEYALFVGDMFLERADYYKKMVKQEWFDKEEVKKMLQKPV